VKPVWPPTWLPVAIRTVFWLTLLLIIVLSLAPIGHPDFSSNDKLNHLLGWGTLGLLACAGWTARWRIIVLLWCASFSLEVAQGLTQYRTFSVADAIANGAGLLIGFLIVTLWDIIMVNYRSNSGKNRIHSE
jgi:hypothetical protein